MTIRGITKDEYYYLKALSIYDYLDGDITLTEPVSFPDNVEGGIGLVSISTESVATIKFKRLPYIHGFTLLGLITLTELP